MVLPLLAPCGPQAPVRLGRDGRRPGPHPRTATRMSPGWLCDLGDPTSLTLGFLHCRRGLSPTVPKLAVNTEVALGGLSPGARPGSRRGHGTKLLLQ